jgi:hypothetical protein
MEYSYSFSGSWRCGAGVDQKLQLDRLVVFVCEMDGATLLDGTRELVVLLLLSGGRDADGRSRTEAALKDHISSCHWVYSRSHTFWAVKAVPQ